MSDPCLTKGGLGVSYREFSCIYSYFEPLYLEMEKAYNPRPVLDYMKDNPLVPVFACGSYVILIFAGQYLMRNQQSWQWRRVMAAWNLLLSVFSFVGMARTFPNLIHNLVTYTLRDNFCIDPRVTYGSGSTGLWVQLFILSKFPELFDTFFIVIHKKPLIFLHWYHHITVLLFCWHSYVTTSPPGIFFVVMNYSVHASMYFYYFLMAIKMRPKWLDPMIITTFQISQMVVGVAVTLTGFYYYSTDKACKIERENNTAAFIMYGSYLFLFLQFFVARYYKAKTTKNRKIA
mmetsp:Transcript_27068/g.30892  ORF Transcript_27068/g.30892 Transcript_27068/m.30892 type:complete len:289 (+) Transcript_27068:77-943(+)